MSFFFILLAVIDLAINFSLTKAYQTKAGASILPSLLFNAMTGTFTAVIFFFIHGGCADIP